MTSPSSKSSSPTRCTGSPTHQSGMPPPRFSAPGMSQTGPALSAEPVTRQMSPPQEWLRARSDSRDNGKASMPKLSKSPLKPGVPKAGRSPRPSAGSGGSADCPSGIPSGRRRWDSPNHYQVPVEVQAGAAVLAQTITSPASPSAPVRSRSRGFIWSEGEQDAVQVFAVEEKSRSPLPQPQAPQLVPVQAKAPFIMSQPRTMAPPLGGARPVVPNSRTPQQQQRALVQETLAQMRLTSPRGRGGAPGVPELRAPGTQSRGLPARGE